VSKRSDLEASSKYKSTGMRSTALKEKWMKELEEEKKKIRV
jgi:hypothetical protein